MPLPDATRLSYRSALRIGGADRYGFLQNIVSNDVSKAIDGEAVYAALLNPQGKFLHDMFIFDHAGAFLIDCEAARADDLLKRLAAYKLRAKVTFENLADVYDVWAIWGGDHAADTGYADPRLAQLGRRAFIAKGAVPENVNPVEFSAYDIHRLTLGIADGSRDMVVEKSTLAECNFDYLNGVDWEKGCYVGQELTARMHYRRLGKKRLFPVRLSGALADTDKTVFFRGAESGHMCSHNGQIGLALLSSENVNLSIMQKVPFNCGNYGVIPFYPDWLILD